MQLYTIILVDDEEEIREGIIKRIPWGKYGFCIVGSAENGKEALELAEKLQPDVVMTDIMMPFMDGLELGEALNKIVPSTKIIIFSGSDDLEYAHRAIKINVVEYVLKPVNTTDMKETLTKLKLQLDQEYESKRNLETLRQHYLDSIPVIKEQILTSLVEGRLTREQFERNAGLVGINTDALGYTSVLVQIEKNSNNTNDNLFKNHDDALIPITVKQIIDEVLKRYCEFTSFLYGDMIGLIIIFYEKEKINLLMQGIEEICKEIKRIYHLIITTGIGLIYHDIMDIRYARKEAQSALDYRFVLGTGRAIYIGDVESDNSIVLQFQDLDERMIISAIKMGDLEEIEKQVDQVFTKFENTVLALTQYKIYFMEIKVSLLRLIQSYHLNIEEIFGETDIEFNLLNITYSLEDMKKWLLQKASKINELIKRERVHSSGLLVERAKQYVTEYYMDSELTVERLSDYLNVSPSYFSTIFKKETGSTFVSYLTDERLQRAVELLNITDDKSYIIAEKVGYKEPNYFSYVFKKKFGVSPSKYRNN